MYPIFLLNSQFATKISLDQMSNWVKAYPINIYHRKIIKPSTEPQDNALYMP